MKSFTHRMHVEESSSGDGPGRTTDPGASVLRDLMEARRRRRSSPRWPRPFVTLAYAQSLDGSIAAARGHRSILSGPESLRLTHRLRACHDGILVGVGTVLADDPELGVRLVGGPSPRPVIVDSRLRTPAAARLLSRPGRSPFIGTTAPADQRGHATLRRMEDSGCRILTCPAEPNGWVGLGVLLARLSAEGIDDLMVEGGARIITSFLAARLVDYAIVTIAPLFMGGLSVVEPVVDPRVIEDPREPGDAAGRARAVDLGPRLASWTSARLGDDLVLAGEIRWATP